MTVFVSLTPSPSKSVEIDIDNSEFKAVHYKNLPPFRIEEQRRRCAAYKDGIFPNSKPGSSETQQVMDISNFQNYIEYSKIMEDEIINYNNLSYLTTIYYDRRGKGWTNTEITNKHGKIVGYCINGFVYHPLDLPLVNKLIFGIVYYGLVNKIPQFETLIAMVRENIGLNLIGDDVEFLNVLKNLLLEKSRA